MSFNRVRALAGAVGSLYLLALAAFAIRVFIKRVVTRRWNVDDYTFSAAFVSAMIHAILISVCIARGYGLNFSQMTRAAVQKFEILQYFAQFFYVLSFGFCRMSYAQFIGTVARGSPVAGATRSLTIVAGIWTVVSIIILAYDGRPSMPWTGTLTHPLFIQWICVEFVGILIELGIFVVAGFLIKRFAMTPVARVKLLLSFAVRILLIPVIFARAASQAEWVNGPQGFPILPIVLMEVALSSSIMMGLATSLTSFLYSFDVVNIFLRSRLRTARLEADHSHEALLSFPEYQNCVPNDSIYHTFEPESVIQHPIPLYPVTPPHTPPNSPAPPEDENDHRVTKVSAAPPCQCNVLPRYDEISGDLVPSYEEIAMMGHSAHHPPAAYRVAPEDVPPLSECRAFIRCVPSKWSVIPELDRQRIAAMYPDSAEYVMEAILKARAAEDAYYQGRTRPIPIPYPRQRREL